MTKTVSILLIVAMFFSAAPAFAASDDKDATDIIIDTTFLRPLGLVSTAFGTAFFIVSLPIAAITGSVGDSFELLVQEPFEYTFRRPLGQIKKTDR